MHEAQLHERNSFLTLTYSDAHLPRGGTLRPKHFTDFMKRLRKSLGHQVRYLHCGEYGGTDAQLGRPHYHAVLFGEDFSDCRYLWKNSDKGFPLYNSPILDAAWQDQGYAVIGDLTFDSAGYTARYCMKKQTGEKAEEHYQRINPQTGEVHKLIPEYNTMSRNHGIGHDWYQQFKNDVYPKDFITFQGSERRVPKYYDRLLKAENRTLHEYVMAARRKKQEERPRTSDEILSVKHKLQLQYQSHQLRTIE